MDDNAENVNYEANVDDHSCTYRSEQFVGIYDATGFNVNTLTHDTTYNSFVFSIVHLQGTYLLVNNIGNTGESMVAQIRHGFPQIWLSTENKPNLGQWTGKGSILNDTKIAFIFMEGNTQILHNETAVRQ